MSNVQLMNNEKKTSIIENIVNIHTAPVIESLG